MIHLSRCNLLLVIDLNGLLSVRGVGVRGHNPTTGLDHRPGLGAVYLMV